MTQPDARQYRTGFFSRLARVLGWSYPDRLSPEDVFDLTDEEVDAELERLGVDTDSIVRDVLERVKLTRAEQV